MNLSSSAVHKRAHRDLSISGKDSRASVVRVKRRLQRNMQIFIQEHRWNYGLQNGDAGVWVWVIIQIP